MKYIGDYDTLRPFIRCIAFGCYHKDFLTQKLGLSPRSYDEHWGRLRFFLPPDKIQAVRHGHKEIHALKGDSYQQDSHYLAKTYQTKALKPKSAFYLLSLLQIFASTDEPLDETTLLQYRLTPDDQPLPPGAGQLSRSTMNRYLKELVQLGLIKRRLANGRYCYQKMPNPFTTLGDEEIRQLKAAVDFYAHIAPLSLPGIFLTEYLQDAFPSASFPDNLAQIKHISPDKIIDEEVLATLLYAIRHHHAVSFSYKNKNIIALPLKVCINRHDGRQYLEAMSKTSPSKRYDQRQTFRLDLMQNLQPAGKTQEKASYAPYPLHALKIAFRTHSPADEESIRRRILRRMPEAEFAQGTGHLLHCTLLLHDDLSILPWLRTFYPHLCPETISSKVLRERLLDDLKEMFENYGLHAPLP